MTKWQMADVLSRAIEVSYQIPWLWYFRARRHKCDRWGRRYLEWGIGPYWQVHRPLLPRPSDPFCRRHKTSSSESIKIELLAGSMISPWFEIKSPSFSIIRAPKSLLEKKKVPRKWHLTGLTRIHQRASFRLYRKLQKIVKINHLCSSLISKSTFHF